MPRGAGRNMAGEKAKDFKGTIKKLIKYMSAFKVHMLFVAVFAICGTVFNIVGPKIQRSGEQGFRRRRDGFCKNRPDSSDHPRTVCDQRPVYVYPGNYHDRSFPEDDIQIEKRNIREDQPYANELF